MATTDETPPPEPTETDLIIQRIDDSLRQIADYLAWLRAVQEADRAVLQARLNVPPPDQANRLYLSGRWPRVDGDIYGKVPPFTAGGPDGPQAQSPPKRN